MRRLLFSCLSIIVGSASWAQISDTYNYSNSAQSFTVPIGVTSITVQCWGAGGGGAGAKSSNGSGGGGGGAYVSHTFSVNGGDVYDVYVGAGGIGGAATTTTSVQGADGGVSYVSLSGTPTPVVSADGGKGGKMNTSADGTVNGGLIANNIPANTGFAGGLGRNGSGSSAIAGCGGGGAGSAGNGGTAVYKSSTPGAGGAPDGGVGGVGVRNENAANPGSTGGATVPGGGGGGATASSGNRVGGNGADGRIIITYTLPNYVMQLSSLSKSSWCEGEMDTITVNVKNIGLMDWLSAEEIMLVAKWDNQAWINSDTIVLNSGDSIDVSLPLTAPAGATTLTFDLIKGNDLFSDNTNGIGPDNLQYQVSVTINTLPNVVATASDTAVCANDSVKLIGQGADSFTWKDENSDNYIDNVSFVPLVDYIYTVLGIDSNTGCKNTADIQVTVNALPVVSVPSAISTCVNYSTIVLSGATPIGGTYSGNNVSNGNFDPSSAAIGNNAIVYTYSDANGCTDTASFDIVVDECLGLDESNTNLVSVYPNPAQDYLYIDNLNNVKLNSIKVIDNIGKVVLEVRKENMVDKINLSQLDNGLYNVIILTNKGNIIKKIAINR